jgi:sec-independent protein translocase protein TatB
VNFSPEKLLLVGVIALVVLGPTRLPQVARTVGRVVAELRRMSSTLQTEVRDALSEPRDALSGSVGDLGLTDLRKSLMDTVNTARETVTGTFTAPGPPPVRALPEHPTAELSAPDASAIPSGSTPIPDDPSLN